MIHKQFATCFRQLPGYITLALLILIPATRADADPRSRTEIIEGVRAILGNDLSPLPEALPGYVRPQHEAPGLVVGNATSKSDDGLPWGAALGGVLRFKMMYTPADHFQMPSMRKFADDSQSTEIPKQDQGSSVASLQLVALRYGLENILLSDLVVSESAYTWKFFLRKAPFQSVEHEFQLTGNRDDLPDALANAVIEIFRYFAIPLDEHSLEFVRRRTPETYEELRQYVDYYQQLHQGKSSDEEIVIAQRLWNTKMNLPSTIVPYVYQLDRITDIAEYNRRLDEVYDRFIGNTGVDFIVAANIRSDINGEYFRSKYERLRRLQRTNPLDPNVMFQIADLYARNRRSADGIAVALEALDRWPGNYLHWWALSEGLTNRAWHYRGGNFWDKVPEQGKRMFPPLIDLANDAIDQALAVNQYSANVWVQKIYANPGYSDELMEYFDHAVRLSPQSKNVYDAVLEYLRPQWGGTDEVREQVFQLALRNNPTAEWARELRKEYSPDEDIDDEGKAKPSLWQLPEHFDGTAKVLLFLLLGALAILSTIAILLWKGSHKLQR